MRVVLDTNVIVAAFAARGLCAEIFQVCIEGQDIILSKSILLEVEEKLAGKIHLPHNIIKDIISYLMNSSDMVKPLKLDKPACRDKNDDMIIETALGGNADYIITGDQDLLVLKKYKSIKIVTPREFWSLLNV